MFMAMHCYQIILNILFYLQQSCITNTFNHRGFLEDYTNCQRVLTNSIPQNWQVIDLQFGPSLHLLPTLDPHALPDWLTLNEDCFFELTKKKVSQFCNNNNFIIFNSCSPLVQNSYQNLHNCCLQNLLKHVTALALYLLLIYHYLSSKNVTHPLSSIKWSRSTTTGNRSLCLYPVLSNSKCGPLLLLVSRSIIVLVS